MSIREISFPCDAEVKEAVDAAAAEAESGDLM